MIPTNTHQVFLSYAFEDKSFLEDLAKHLKPFEGQIGIWHDGMISPGLGRAEQIEHHLESAHLVLLLVSSHYLASEDCREQMQRALERHRARKVRVIPVIVRPSSWKDQPIGQLQVLPRDGRPVISWDDQDEAYCDVVRGIREVIDIEFRQQQSPRPEPNYQDAATRRLAKDLDERYRKKADLETKGADTKAIIDEILDLKRRIREGAQLHAGDSLLDGRFQLLDPIGQGGFAQVWKAYDAKRRAQVAVKVLHPQYARDETRRQRFFRGARQMARLAHPGIVRVIEESCEDGGFRFFAMEYVAGGDLHAAVIGRKLSSRQRQLEVLLELGEALAFAHEKGVIHRDVKPANILLDSKGRPKLTDFDLVRAFDTTGGTRIGGILGTIGYAAPELLEQAQDAREAADIYGLGMTAVFIFYGAILPLTTILRGPDQLIAGLEIPEACRESLSRAVALEIEERPQSVREFCRGLKESLAEKRSGATVKVDQALSVTPKHVPLISGIAPRRILVISNSSAQPCRIRIVRDPKEEPFPAVVFDPTEFTVPANRKTGVLACLDEKALPKSFTSRSVRYRCEIDGDSRRIVPFTVAAKAGPKPQLVTLVLDFGAIEKDAVPTRQLEIWNRGGVPLILREVRPEGSSQLHVAEDTVVFPLKVMPGEKQAIDVVLDTRRAETAVQAGQAAGFRFSFGNYPKELFAGVKAEIVHRKLGVEPDPVHLRDVFCKHDRIQPMVLTNLGTVGIEITKVTSRTPWIEIARDKDARTTLPPGGFHEFELVLHPQKLTAGSHRGKIEVSIGGQKDPVFIKVRIDVLHPEKYDDYIGIDFGTTNSVVALLNPREQDIEIVEVGLPSGSHSPLIPSLLVFLSNENSYVTGFPARNEAEVRPDKVVRSIKRLLGTTREHEFFGRKFSPADLAGMIIRSLVECAERRLFEIDGRYRDVRKAIVTVPANFFDLQIRDTLDACVAAGIDVEEVKSRAAIEAAQKVEAATVRAGILIDRPSAAALYYLAHLEQIDPELAQKIRAEKGLHALVYDHGDDSLDVSLVRVHQPSSGQPTITLLANHGDNRVGGESIDLALIKRILPFCWHKINQFDKSLICAKYKDLESRRQRENWSDTTREDVLRARYRWKDTVKRVRMELSKEGTTRFEMDHYGILCQQDGKIEYAPNGYEMEVTRMDLMDASKPLLNRCRELLRNVVEIAELDPEDVDYVFHTNKQSLFPGIREMVNGVFQKLEPGNIVLEEQTMRVCVAKGAALYGLAQTAISAERGVVFVDDSRKLSHSYGVENVDGIFKRRFEVLLPKGTRYPARQEKQYSPQEIPSDNWLTLKIYKNSGSVTEIEGNPEICRIGQIRIDTMADGEPGCTLVFIVDVNRQLKVFADQVEVPIELESIEDEDGWLW